jgi:hypothetical protein
METTEEKPPVNDLSDLLGQLEEFRDSNLHDIYVPSLDQIFQFKQLTVRQQSSIITGLIAQETQRNVFSYNRVISDIILENKDVDCELSVIDKVPVLVQLRCATVGSDIEISDNSIDLSAINFSLSGDEPELLKSHEYTNNGITVTYGIPTLKLDQDINNSAEKRWVNTEGEDIVTELFKVEISKYIYSVKFDSSEIQFSKLTPDEKLQVCDKLPMDHSRILVDFVEDQKKLEERLGTVEVDGEIYEIPVDESLFSTPA